MASIQKSMYQFLGAVAGASTMGAYMVRGSNWYKAGQAEKSAKTIEKTLDVSEEQPQKASYPTLATLLGIVTEVREEQ